MFSSTCLPHRSVRKHQTKKDWTFVWLLFELFFPFFCQSFFWAWEICVLEQWDFWFCSEQGLREGLEKLVAVNFLYLVSNGSPIIEWHLCVLTTLPPLQTCFACDANWWTEHWSYTEHVLSFPEDLPLCNSQDVDEDVLSVSAMSIASSSSLASEVYERARRRRDEFWGKPAKWPPCCLDLPSLAMHRLAVMPVADGVSCWSIKDCPTTSVLDSGPLDSYKHHFTCGIVQCKN